MEELLRQLITEVKNINTNMATKADLEKLATKEDLAKVDAKVDMALNALTILQSGSSHSQETQDNANERIFEALSRIEGNSARVEGSLNRLEIKVDKISRKVSLHDEKLHKAE